MMNTQTLNKKLELIQWLSTLEDRTIIDKLMQFRQTEAKDWWTSISNEEQQSIEQGILEADSQNLQSHSTVRKLYEKWL